MLAQGIQAVAPALQQAMGNVSSGAVLEGGLKSLGGAQKVGRDRGHSITMTINISGIGSAGDAEDVADVFEERVRRVIEDLQRNQMRVSYG